MVEPIIGTPGGSNVTGANPLLNKIRSSSTSVFSQADSLVADRNAMRWNLLRTTGMEGFSDEFSSIGLGLVQSNLADDEIVARMVNAVQSQAVPKMMKYLEEMEDDMQESQFQMWHPNTQALLRTNGYELPDERNNVTWWNPFDWDDKMPAWLAASTPFHIAMAPFRHGLSPLTRGTWEGLNKSMRLGLRLQRTFSMEWERRLAETNGGLGGAVQASSRGLLSNFSENWQNAEFERASFTEQAKDNARDLLTDEDDFQILIGTLRHEGNLVKAGIDYFTELSASQGAIDPEGQGIQNFLAWMDKDVTNMPEWNKAIETLSRGNVEAGAMSARQYDRVIETAHLGFLDNVKIPGTNVSANSIGKVGSVFVGTLGSAILFDPITVATLGYAAVIKAARVGVSLKNAGAAAIKLKSLEDLTTTVRAVNKLKETPKARRTIETAEEILSESARLTKSKTPTQLLKTEGRVKGVLKPKNLVKEQEAYIKDFEPNWLGKMPFYLKRQANHIINEFELIMNHFRAHEMYKKGANLKSLNGFQNIQEGIDPLTLFMQRKPHYAGELQNMIRYHEANKLTGMSVADLDLLPQAIKNLPPEFQTNLLRVKTPGLDTWEGVWGFFQSQAGMSALMGSPIGRAGLAGRTHKFFIPRHTKWSQNRIRLRSGMNNFLDRKAFRIKQTHETAYGEAGNLFHMIRQEAMVLSVLTTVKKGTGLAWDNSSKVKNLSPNELMDIVESTSSNVGKLKEYGTGGKGAVNLDESTRVMNQYGLTQKDVNQLRELVQQRVDVLTEDITKTVKALKAGENPSGVSDDIINLVEEHLPQLTDFFTVDEQMRGGPLRFKDGKARFRKSSGMMRAGRNMLRNSKHHINAPSGHFKSTNALPNVIEPLGNKTWKEIASEGINWGIYDTRLSLAERFSWAGYNTPGQFLDAINNKGMTKVVRDLNAWSGPKINKKQLLNWLKDNLGVVITEKRYYNPVGVLKDSALATAYTMAHPFVNLMNKLSKIAPKKGFIDVGSPTAIKDFKALLEMGIKADMPRHTLDQYLSIFINGTPAQRWDVQSSFLMDFAGRTGLLLYGGQNAERWLQQFIRQGAHHYSNFGQDVVTSSFGRTKRAIVPGAEKEAQVSNLNIIPSWRELGQGARYMNMTSYLGYMPFGPAMIDMWFRRYWQPAVLLKFGVGIRNASDEGLQFVLREGPTAWLNAKLAKWSLNRAKVYGAWGELLTQPVSDETRRSLLLRPLIRSYRFALDTLTIGDAAVTKAAARKANREHGHFWGAMTADEIVGEILEFRKKVQTGTWRGFFNSIFGSNSRYVQNADGTLNKEWYDWIGLLGMAEAFSNKAARSLHAVGGKFHVPTKAKVSEKALKLLRSDADLYRQRTLEMFQNPIVMDSAYEQLFGTYRAYYGKNHLTAVDEMLQLNAHGIGTTRGLLPYVKLMDNSRWDVVGSGAVQDTGILRQDALGQNLVQFKNDPTMQRIGITLSHYVDQNIRKHSLRLVDDDLIYEIGRATGKETHEISRAKKADPLFHIKFAYDMIEEIPDARRLLTAFYKTVGEVKAYSPRQIVEFKALPRKISKKQTFTIEELERHISRSLANGNHLLNEFFTRLLAGLRREAGSEVGHGYGGPDAVAFLLQSGKNVDDFTTSMDDVLKAMVQSGVDELAGTYHGQQSMEALVRTGGLDPTIARTLDNVLPNEIAIYYPYVSADTATLLAWTFREVNTPIGTQMFDKLEELLSLRIGIEEARQVAWLLNPMNRIWGSIDPQAWLGLHVNRAGELMSRATRAQGSATPQGLASELAVLLGEPQLKDVTGTKVPLLAGSYSVTDMRGVIQGLQDWRNWLDDVDLIPDQVGVSDVIGSDLDGMLVRKKVSKAEFFAEAGFGRYYGSTSGHRFMRPDGTMGYDEDPLTVLLYGDNWGDVDSVPTGWHQATEDGVPIPNEWEPDASNEFMKTTLSKREWLEAEVSNLVKALMSLSPRSRVRYSKPIAKSGKASYDRFGKTVEKILTLLKDHSGGTIRDLELAIWQTVGDFPANKIGVEEAITTLLQQADDGTYYLKTLFDGEWGLRTEEIIRRAKQYPTEVKGMDATPLLGRELRGFDNETLAKAIVELEQRGDASNGILELLPLEGFTSDALIRNLKGVLKSRPANYKGYRPSIPHRLDPSWQLDGKLVVENIPDEVLLTYLMYGTGAHKSKQFIHNALDLPLSGEKEKFIKTINDIAEELWMRGYEVYDETPRALWFKYVDEHAEDHHSYDQLLVGRQMAEGKTGEMSPYTRGTISYVEDELTGDKLPIRGFTARGQTSLFDEGAEGLDMKTGKPSGKPAENVRYTGPRYEIEGEQVEKLLPDEIRSDLESKLNTTRERRQALEDERDMYEYNLELEQIVSRIEEDDFVVVDEVVELHREMYGDFAPDEDYLNDLRVQMEALDEDEAVLLERLDELITKRPTYMEILQQASLKDTELLGVDDTLKLLSDTREKLLSTKRGVLTNDLANLRKQRKSAIVEDFGDVRRPIIDSELEWIDGEIGQLVNLARKLADEGLIDDADDFIGLNFYIQNAKLDPSDDLNYLVDEAIANWDEGNLGTDVLDEMAENYAYIIDPAEWNKFEEWFNANIAWLKRQRGTRRPSPVEGARDATRDFLLMYADDLLDDAEFLSSPTLLMNRRNELIKTKEKMMTGTDYQGLVDEIASLEQRLVLDGTVPKRDFIGTIGGVKGDTGLRRIWPELPEDSIVPNLDLIPEPFAPADEIFPNALRYDEGGNAPAPAAELWADVEWTGPRGLAPGFLPEHFGEGLSKATGRKRSRFSPVSRRERLARNDQELGGERILSDAGQRPVTFDPSKRKPRGRRKAPFKTGLNAWRFRNKYDPDNIYAEGTWLSGGGAGQTFKTKSGTMREGGMTGTGEPARTEPTELLSGITHPNVTEVPFADGLQIMAYRKSHASSMITNNEIDIVLPFFRNTTRVDTAKGSSFKDVRQARPSWALGLELSARKSGIPINWAVRAGQDSGVDKIVKSRLMSAYPEHSKPRSIYTARVIQNPTSERPEVFGFSAGDVGGFDETDKFVATNPTDLLGEQIEIVGHVDEVQKTNTYINADGKIMILREGQESLHPSFQNTGKILEISDETTTASGYKNPLSLFYEHEEGLFFRGHTFKTGQGAYEAFKTGTYRTGFTNKTGMQAKSKGLAMQHLPLGVKEKQAFALTGGGVAEKIPFAENIKYHYKGHGFVIDAIIANSAQLSSAVRKAAPTIKGFTSKWQHVKNVEVGDVIKLYAPRKKGSEATGKEVWVEVTEKIQLKFDDITPEEWAAAEGLDVGTAKWHWKAKGGRRGVAPEKETSLNLKDGGWTQIRFKVVAVPDNYPMAHGKAGEAAPEFYSGVTRIVSGGNIGVEQAGLRTARAMDIKTGGTSAKGWAVWDRTTDAPASDIATLQGFDLKEGVKGADNVEKNIIDSGGTVIFDPKAEGWRRLSVNPRDQLSEAMADVYILAKRHKRQVIVNPSGSELAHWLKEHEIRTVHVTGSRLRTADYSNHIREEEQIERVLRQALRQNKKLGETQVVDISNREDLLRAILEEKWKQSVPFKNALSKAGSIVNKSEDPFWAENFPRILSDIRNEKLLDNEFRLIDQQINGPVDQLNQAEMQSKILSRETSGLFSTGSGNNASGNYVGLLELTEEAIGLNGMGSRLRSYVNETTMPDQMLARIPVTAPRTAQERFEVVVRGFFEGAIQPVIAAMIREPMFTHYFVESKELTRGIRYFYNHEPNAFGALRKEVNKALVPKEKGQKKLNVLYKKDESGVVQTLLPDFEDFNIIVRSQAQGALEGHAEAVVAVALDDFMQGLRSRDSVLEQLFSIKAWNKNNPKYRDLKSVRGESAEEAMETAEQIAKHKARGATTDGDFFKAFPEYEELFIEIWKRSNAQDKGRTYKVVTRQLVEYLNLKHIQERAHTNEAIKRALWMTSDFIDDHSVRSLFQETVGTLLPFWFAEEQFYKRWIRTLETRPDALSRLNASLHASQNSGLIFIDENDRKRILIPGSNLITASMDIPAYALSFFGKDAFGLIHGGDLSMSVENMMPGYSDKAGIPAGGPLAAIAVQTASLANPELRGDGVFGFEDHLVSKFGYGTSAAEIAWSSVLPPPLGKMVSGILGWELPGYAGGRQKANLSVVETAWSLGMLPSDKMVVDSSNPAKFKQDVLDGINHEGKQLQVLQNLTWWAGFTTATPKDFTLDGTQKWNEIFQTFLDYGFPHEVAYEKTLEFRWNDFVEKSRREGMTDDQIFETWWSSEILKFSVFMTGKFGKTSLARQPSTRASLAWMEENMSLLQAYSLAGPYFMPVGETEEDKEGSSEAKRLQLALGLKVLKTEEEYIEDLYVNAASYQYYLRMQNYDEVIQTARANKDNILRDAAEKEKASFKSDFLASHPIFENSLFSQESKKRREDTVDQFRLIVSNPDLVSEGTPHKQDILVAMGEVVSFDDQYSLLTGRRDDIAVDRRNRLKYEYNEWFKLAILNRPWLYPLYYSLFVPMIQESWITKVEAGVYPELTGVG